MVALLQKVLQLYASRQLSQPAAAAAGASSGSSESADALLTQLLAADEAAWAGIVRQHAQQGDIRWAGPGQSGAAVNAREGKEPEYEGPAGCVALRCVPCSAVCSPCPGAAGPGHPAMPSPACSAGPSARSELALLEALQRRMEGVVLGLPSGSYAQVRREGAKGGEGIRFMATGAAFLRLVPLRRWLSVRSLQGRTSPVVLPHWRGVLRCMLPKHAPRWQPTAGHMTLACPINQRAAAGVPYPAPQRVCAEYLKELEERAKGVFKAMAKPKGFGGQ